VAFGLPDWVFPGALAVMLLGLPVILLTWHVNRTMRRLATMTPALTPGGRPASPSTMTNLAIKASPHVTWRRTLIGSAAALGVFALVVAGFMLLRSLGVGPVGSLLAAGKLSDRERLIVTEFQSPDSSLGTLVTEAVRTNLGQSRAVSIMPPVAIAAALQRMQQPPSSRLTLPLAREIAAREGVKAIVDGAIRPLGGGYAVSLRLVSADSVKELAAYRATADGPRQLLETIDDLTRKLRGKIGESLRDVRGSPPLEQVTTPSFEALRIYAEAARMIDMGGNPLDGAERLREAVRIDTQFAMAYRKLGVALNNSGMPRVRVDSALERAYRFRNRLTERERLLAEGTYYQLGPGRDRRRAIRAYEALLAIDPSESGAANNLASIYNGQREFARAESLFKAQIAGGRATSQQYTNLIPVLFNGGKVEEAESVSAEYRRRFPAALAAITAPINFLYHRGQLDSMELVLRELARSSNPILKVNGVSGLASYSLLRGRPEDTRRYGQEAQRIAETLGQPSMPLGDSLRLSWLDIRYFDDTTRALRRVESTLAATDLRSLPVDQRPYAGLAVFFATAGRPDRARAFHALNDADMPDSIALRTREPERHAILGEIAAAEGRYSDAVRELWRADTTYDGPNGSCTICLLDDIGWVWSRAGVADSAIHYWERFLETPYFGRQGLDANQRPLILRRLGELYEVKGDTANAVRRYREFVRLWERADARLQPKVAEVRRRLAALEQRRP
jgi:eukaryotic-like serine/threonine-protein kinase